MSTPIYLNNNSTDELTKTLLSIAVSRQQNDIAKERLKLEQGKFKHDQEVQEAEAEKQRIAQEQQAGQAAAALAPMMALLSGAIPVLPTMNGPVPNAAASPQGMQAFQQSPAAQQYMQIQGRPDLSPTAKLAAANPIAERFKLEQAKIETGRVIEEMITLAGPSWTEAERNHVRALGVGAQGTALPKELLVSLIPPDAQKKLEIRKALVEAEGAENAAAADKISTEALIKMGRLSPGTGPVVGATKMLADENSKIAADVRQENITIRKEARDRAVNSMLGDALSVAIGGGGNLSPEAIKAQLKAAHPNLSDGELMKAAVAAHQDTRELYTPKGDVQAKLWLTYPVAAAAAKRLDDLDLKGVEWNTDSEGALAEWKVPGNVDLGTFGTLARQFARSQLKPDQQTLFNSVLAVVEAQKRSTSGAQISKEEFQMAVLQLAPQQGESPEAKAAKRQDRSIVMQSMDVAAQLPPALRRVQEQAVLNASAPPPVPATPPQTRPAPRRPATPPRGGGRR